MTRHRLGRGLGALIPGTAPDGHPDGPAAGRSADGGAVNGLRELPVDAIEPNPRQPRQEFDPDALAELAWSIREVGLLQPVVVRPVPTDPDRFQLVVGERRWRAARQVGLTHLPALIRRTADDDLLRDALLENLHRAELNPLEEAAGYRQLLDDFGVTHEQLAERLGRSRAHVSNTIRLLALPPPVQRRVAAGVLSAGHARALLAVADPQRQEALAARIVAEGMSVRATEEAVAVPADGRLPRRRAAGAATAPGPTLDEIAATLSERLETTVRVHLGRSKGRLTVDFAGLEDLERIVALLAPPAPAGPRRG